MTFAKAFIWVFVQFSLHFCKFFTDISKRKKFFFDFFYRQKFRVVGVEFGKRITFCVPLIEVLIVIQPAIIARDSIEIAEVDSMGALLVGKERFVHFFAVSNTYNFNGILVAAKQLANGFRLHFQRTRRRLLHEDIAALAASCNLRREDIIEMITFIMEEEE